MKAFCISNKNDMADAEALWRTAQERPGRTVSVKAEAQRSMLAPSLGEASARQIQADAGR